MSELKVAALLIFSWYYAYPGNCIGKGILRISWGASEDTGYLILHVKML